MAKNYLTEIDTTDGADTVYDGFVTTDANMETIDNEIYAARKGATDLETEIDIIVSDITSIVSDVVINTTDIATNTANISASPSYSYIVDSSEVDQGIAGSGKTLNTYIDAIGSDEATIYLPHDSGSSETTYTLSTDETVPDNIALVLQNGALFSIDSGKVLTVYSPGHIQSSLVQIFSGDGTVEFSSGGIFYPEWWGDTGDGSTDDFYALNAAIVAANSSSSYGKVLVQPGVHKTSDQLDTTSPWIEIEGHGSRNTYIFHQPASGTESCIKISGTTTVGGATRNTHVNDGSIIMRNIAFGSLAGAGVELENCAKFIMENVDVFSAAITAPCWDIKGCVMGAFNNCQGGPGNQEFPAEWDAVLADLTTRGLYGFSLTSPADGNGRSTYTGELWFENCRADGGYDQHAVYIDIHVDTNFSAQDIHFNGCKLTGDGNANVSSIAYVSGAQTFWNGTYFEASSGLPNAIEIRNDVRESYAYLYNCQADSGYINISQVGTERVELVVIGGQYRGIKNAVTGAGVIDRIVLLGTYYEVAKTGSDANYTTLPAHSLILGNQVANSGDKMLDYVTFNAMSSTTTPLLLKGYFDSNSAVEMKSIRHRGTPDSPGDLVTDDYVFIRRHNAQVNSTETIVFGETFRAMNVAAGAIKGQWIAQLRDGASMQSLFTVNLNNAKEFPFNVPVGLPVYTNGTRPAANTLSAGVMIWNSDDNAPNFSDGSAWRDAAGSTT